MKTILACIAIALFAGCALTPAKPGTAAASPSATSAASVQVFSLVDTPLAKFQHADLLQAASIATANGFTARAAVYTALDAQVTACENAITAAVPKLPPAGTTLGLATGYEITAEAVGEGIPPAVRVNCAAFPLP